MTPCLTPRHSSGIYTRGLGGVKNAMPPMPPGKQKQLLRYKERYAALKAKLQDIGFICRGSTQTRYTLCGKGICRCHEDPAYRHGPYHYWTRKARGKTVGLLLTETELSVYSAWIENHRTLDHILREMRRGSARALALKTGRKAP